MRLRTHPPRRALLAALLLAGTPFGSAQAQPTVQWPTEPDFEDGAPYDPASPKPGTGASSQGDYYTPWNAPADQPVSDTPPEPAKGDYYAPWDGADSRSSTEEVFGTVPRDAIGAPMPPRSSEGVADANRAAVIDANRRDAAIAAEVRRLNEAEQRAYEAQLAQQRASYEAQRAAYEAQRAVYDQQMQAYHTQYGNAQGRGAVPMQQPQAPPPPVYQPQPYQPQPYPQQP